MRMLLRIVPFRCVSWDSFDRAFTMRTPLLRTRRDMLAYLSVQTLFCVVVVVAGTVGSMFFHFGGDLTRVTVARDELVFGICMAAGQSIVFTPLIAWRTVKLLRKLTLAQDELDRLATTDPLTGLDNRRGFERAASAALVAKGPVAGLVFDLDHFKSVNDRFGHEVGDEALRHFSTLLRRVGEEFGAALGRRGGEEFVGLVQETIPDRGRRFGEALRAALAQKPFEVEGRHVNLTVSVGVGRPMSGETDLERLLVGADAAVYAAKRLGRDRVVREGEDVSLAA